MIIKDESREALTQEASNYLDEISKYNVVYSSELPSKLMSNCLNLIDVFNSKYTNMNKIDILNDICGGKLINLTRELEAIK